MNNKTINKHYVYGKYEDKLLELMAEGNADFVQADKLIALGAEFQKKRGEKKFFVFGFDCCFGFERM